MPQAALKHKEELTSISIDGVIDRVVFASEKGYTVLAVRDQATGDKFSAVGNMLTPRVNDVYSFSGAWTQSPKYGRQFQFESAKLKMPSGKAGVARYIASVTYGVGVAKAQRIVDALGEDALERIKKNPAVLDHPALTFLNAEQKEAIAGNLTRNAIQAELAGMIIRPGVGMGTVARIMAQYGNEAVLMVKENPYMLTDDVYGIGFITADAIATGSVGVPADSPYRVEAAVDYLLQEAGSEGHVYLEPKTIVAGCLGRKGLLKDSGVDVGMIAKANQSLISIGKCIREGDAIYTSRLYHAEISVANAVRRLTGKDGRQVSGLDTMIRDLGQKYGKDYAPEQYIAIRSALESPLSVITGGPGTGKTEVTRAIVELYSRINISREVYLCAPTGRAAKRLGEATEQKEKSRTIHRLLRYNPRTGDFEYGSGNPLPGPGLLIVDEVSMVDIELADRLFSAVEDLQVVLIGDIDQLPSVGPGSVLRDIITSGAAPVTRLKYNFRQAGGSVISRLANEVCQGRVPELRSEGDFEYLPVESNVKGAKLKDEDKSAYRAAQTVLALAAGVVAEGYSLLDWQVLAPQHKGSCGVTELNRALRELINPDTRLVYGPFRAGDKVMVVKNDYGLGVFNGDVGIVSDIDFDPKRKKEMLVDFGEGFLVGFPQDKLNILNLAYVSTIHKSQGSQYPVVIMPLVSQHFVMLQRNLLYTGMTRAKRRLILIAEEQSIRRAVKNNVIEKRFSMLADRIRK